MALGDRPHGCGVYGLRQVLVWQVSSDFGDRPRGCWLWETAVCGFCWGLSWHGSIGSLSGVSVSVRDSICLIMVIVLSVVGLCQ